MTSARRRDLENDERAARRTRLRRGAELVFVTAAGSHNWNVSKVTNIGEDVNPGAARDRSSSAATMRRTGLLTDGAPARPAYPVYCVYDAARALLFASNDAEPLEVVGVSDAAQPVVGEVAAVPELAYVSQLALDAPSNLIIAASQKATPWRSSRGGRREPQILGSLTSDALDGATGVAYDAARRLAYVASEFAGTLSVVSVADGSRHRRGRMRVWKSTTESQPRHRADVASMAWSPRRFPRRSRTTRCAGEAVAFDAARRRVFVASRTSACLVEADVRDAAAPTVVAALCTPRTPADAVRSWRWLRGPCSSFCSRFGSRRRACSRKRRAARAARSTRSDEGGYTGDRARAPETRTVATTTTTTTRRRRRAQVNQRWCRQVGCSFLVC